MQFTWSKVRRVSLSHTIGGRWYRNIARRATKAFTVIELVIVLAVLAIIAAIAVPALSSVLSIEQHSAIKEMGQTLTWLQEEAALRNVAFRMEINLDRNTWKVKQGDPTSLIFSTPEEAEEFREEQKDKMKRFTKRQAEENQINLNEDPSKLMRLKIQCLPPAQSFLLVLLLILPIRSIWGRWH